MGFENRGFNKPREPPHRRCLVFPRALTHSNVAFPRDPSLIDALAIPQPGFPPLIASFLQLVPLHRVRVLPAHLRADARVLSRPPAGSCPFAPQPALVSQLLFAIL